MKCGDNDGQQQIHVNMQNGCLQRYSILADR